MIFADSDILQRGLYEELMFSSHMSILATGYICSRSRCKSDRQALLVCVQGFNRARAENRRCSVQTYTVTVRSTVNVAESDPTNFHVLKLNGTNSEHEEVSLVERLISQLGAQLFPFVDECHLLELQDKFL
ncbi:unnamed protein product [Ceratitis capitata]|uniref:(Mediterranean fruit fly) hypothetical protein n=1 Tax=Ceratitis capitata TaxID=7213 RepID=A0A811VDK6_CERCA|nr:unnamed protein product [Ceratitis capitata]